MTTEEFAKLRGCSRRTVARAVRDGLIPAAAVRITGKPGKRSHITIINPDLAMRSWIPSGKWCPPDGGAPAPETEYERHSAAVAAELGELSRTDRASLIAEANKCLAWHREVLGDIARAKKSRRLNAELESFGRWLRSARESLVWAKVIARKRDLSDLDVNHIEGFIDDALHLLLGDPELGSIYGEEAQASLAREAKGL